MLSTEAPGTVARSWRASPPDVTVPPSGGKAVLISVQSKLVELGGGGSLESFLIVLENKWT